MFKKLSIGLGSVIIIAAILICAVPLKTVSYTVTVPYQETETYYVKESYTVQEPYTVREPYTKTETYSEREPYNKSVPIDYIVTGKGTYSWFWSTGFDVWVYIKNTDIKSGTFSVIFYLTLQGGATTTRSVSKYIAIGDTKQLKATYSGAHLKSYTYSITPPTKTVTDYRDVKKTREVTEYRDVTKYRTVTKYRDVPKERTVTKTRQETRYKDVTILEYLTSY